MNKELQIGQIGVIDGVRVECCKGRTCRDCAFTLPPTILYFSEIPIGNCRLNDIEMSVCCAKEYRSDNTDVYFKKID